MTHSIFIGMLEFPSSQPRLSTATTPEVGFLIQKVGFTAPSAIAKSKMAAPHQQQVKAVIYTGY